jgi:hypothetical protein
MELFFFLSVIFWSNLMKLIFARNNIFLPIAFATLETNSMGRLEPTQEELLHVLHTGGRLLSLLANVRLGC